MPHGYTLSYWTRIERSFDENIELYLLGVEQLVAVANDTPKEDFERSQRNESWTVRQIIHHIADLESMTFPRLLTALAEPGGVFRSSPYSQDYWVESLGHATRSVEPSITLVKAIRQQVVSLIRHIPEARNVVSGWKAGWMDQ